MREINAMAKTGRPKKYTSNRILQKRINEYFDFCDANKKPYTVCGLASFLNIHRDTLNEYCKNPEFSDTLKMAKLKIEGYLEEQLFNKDVSTAGVIFNLKNNFGWKDKQEQDVNINGNFKVALVKFI